MMTTTIGKYRHLMRSSAETGVFNIIAIDHRANLREQLDAHTPTPTTDAELAMFKQGVVAAVIDHSTALLTDPAFGMRAAVDAHHAGLLAPVEVTDYSQHPSRRAVRFIPGWSVGKIKRMGGDGVKMLLPWHPADTDTDKKLDAVRGIVADCTEHDIPFYLEPVAYSLAPEIPLSNADLLDIVVDAAERFSKMGADVLKLQFPVDARQSTDKGEWRAACARVNAACTVPWVLLSAGVDFDVFAQQAEIACQSGASGVIVGRAVWKEAVSLHGEAREQFLTTAARQRMATLREICQQHAAPWFERVTPPALSPDWYIHYGEETQ